MPRPWCATPDAHCARASGYPCGRLHRAINDLDTLLERTRRVVAQTRSRLAGVMPDSASRMVSLHDVDARPIRKGRLGKPVEFGYKAQVVDNADGVILDHNIEIGNPADGPQLAPAIQRITSRTRRAPRAVTADRGYGQASVEARAARARRPLAWQSRAASKPSAARREFEHRRAFRDKIKWRTGSEGRINHLKRSYGWNRTELTGITEPEPGADTASSPTTSSRSAPWQHETHTRPSSATPSLGQPRLTPSRPRSLFQVEVARSSGDRSSRRPPALLGAGRSHHRRAVAAHRHPPARGSRR